MRRQSQSDSKRLYGWLSLALAAVSVLAACHQLLARLQHRGSKHVAETHSKADHSQLRKQISNSVRLRRFTQVLYSLN